MFFAVLHSFWSQKKSKGGYVAYSQVLAETIRLEMFHPRGGPIDYEVNNGTKLSASRSSLVLTQLSRDGNKVRE